MFSKFQSLPSYFGGKRKLVKYIFKPIKKTEGVFIDAFLGGGSVSLYAKAKGYKVIANDIAFRSVIIGRALISNNSVKLETEDLARLFLKAKHDFVYEVNYGFISGVKAPDGKELDAYYLGVNEPLEKAKGEVVAIIHRTNDDDDKLVVVPDGVVLTDEEIKQQVHFQEQWFESIVIRK
ncbi:MAG: DNA adenine methylase [Candidatus Paceibacterota bacterium]